MSHQAIARRARLVRTAPPQGRQLRVVPILGPSHTEPAYQLLDGSTLSRVRITEISAAGSVPELLVQNDLDERVFLMDGQELRGAKQNRILNTDVLVPVHSKLKIPVSCVEQGRWRQTSGSFVPGKAASHRTRSGKTQRVYASLQRNEGYDADQSEVWNEVSHSLASASVVSQTMALSDAYAQRQQSMDDFRAALTLPPDAVGLAVFDRDRLLGADVFDRHSTLAYFWSSLLDSYALEGLTQDADPVGNSPGPQADVQQVLSMLMHAAEGNWESFAAPGEGKDWRMQSDRLSAAALVFNEEVVMHLQLFARSGDQGAAGQSARTSRRPRIHRPWMST